MRQLPRPAAPRAATLASALLLIAPLASGLATEPDVTPPLGGGESVTLEPVAPPAAPRAPRAIYVCQQSGIPVYADRPCGDAAEPRTLTVAPPPTGGPPLTSAPRPQASTRPLEIRGDDGDSRERRAGARCLSLQREVDQLNDRMRTGYSAREAARLWQRWRDAKERLRAAHCR